MEIRTEKDVENLIRIGLMTLDMQFGVWYARIIFFLLYGK